MSSSCTVVATADAFILCIPSIGGGAGTALDDVNGIPPCCVSPEAAGEDIAI